MRGWDRGETGGSVNEMNRRQKDRKEILEQIRSMAKSRPNDAVKLAFLDKDQVGIIDEMDLMMLSELKRSGNGGVEVKLNDPLQTMERLLELLDDPKEQQAESFFRAYEAGAEHGD